MNLKIKKLVSGRQIAAGRALLGMTQSELAARASISIPTLKRMEASDGVVQGLTNNVEAVCRALEAAGIVFIDPNGQGAGVRLKEIPQT